MVAAKGNVELKAAAAKVVLARGTVELEHSAAVVAAAPKVAISDSAVGVLLARQVDARNVRVLFGLKEAIAFGAAAGVALSLFNALRRR
jgi:hypothetical protein